MARRTAKKTTRKAAKKTTRKTTRTKTNRRKTTRKATHKVNAPWDVSVNERVILVELPWEMSSLGRQHGVKVDSVGWAIPESSMPPYLAPYAVKDYSWGRYVQDRINGELSHNAQPTLDTGEFTLRDDQIEDASSVVNCWNQGGPEFLIASGTGTGKTVTSVAAINQYKGDVVLVVCPKSVIPSWRRTISKMGDGGKTWIIINYESTKKLLKPPSSAVNAKTAKTKNKNTALHGTPWFKADIVVCDETHKVKNPTSQQSRVVDKFMSTAKGLRLSATPGGPAELHYLRRGFIWATGDDFSINPDDKSFSDYVSWCKKHGVNGIETAQFGNGIVFNGGNKDAENMNKILFSPAQNGSAWAIRRVIDHWPQQERMGIPLELTPDQHNLYNMEWERFKKTMADVDKGLTSQSKKVAHNAKMEGLAAQVRYRQKVGSLKTDFAVELTKDMLSDGNQVVLSVVFHDTATRLSELLDKSGINHVVLTGDNVANRESDRIKFQKGDVKVMISSITTGVSYHQGDSTVGGNDAPRKMIVVESSYSAQEQYQTEGRVTRDGKMGQVNYLFATDTIDEKVISTVLSKMSMQATVLGDGDDGDMLTELGEVMGVTLV